MKVSMREKIIQEAVQWVVLLLLVFGGLIIWRTWGPVSAPVSVLKSEYQAKKIHDGTIVVYYTCESTFYDELEVHVHREAVHESGLSVSLPTVNAKYTSGKHHTQRQFYIPAPAPSGKWCVKSISEWQPLFSLRDRVAGTNTECFEVK